MMFFVGLKENTQVFALGIENKGVRIITFIIGPEK